MPPKAADAYPLKAKVACDGLANCEVMSSKSDAVAVKASNASILVVVVVVVVSVVVVVVIVMVVSSPYVFVLVSTLVVVIGALVTLSTHLVDPTNRPVANPTPKLKDPPVPSFTLEALKLAWAWKRVLARPTSPEAKA